MYKVLVVDDEPTVSAGIKSYLMKSALGILHVETALNGFEALDCLRLDNYDLVLTDIQMGMMNGIELMEAILLEQPYLPVIVISAHEKFDFAKKALRLGAKDYLIKPVELDELTRVVGKALQEKKEMGRLTLQRPGTDTSLIDDHIRKKRHEALIELVTETGLQEKDYEDLLREIGSSLKEQGYWYGIAAVHLNLSRGGFSNQDITLMDRKLLKYASVNILEESLADWCGVAFYGFGNQLVCVIQLEASEPADTRLNRNSQLNLIGQTIIVNLKQYLNVDVTVGMSTLSPDLTMLPKLMEEASAAIEWRKLHPDNNVLYYEDMSALGSMRVMEWAAKVEELALHIKTADEAGLAKELQSAIKILSNLTHREGLFHSFFGLLVYRLYGLLFDSGQESSNTFRQWDPDVYFKGMESGRKVTQLHEYVQGLADSIRASMSERDLSVVSRITAYIYNHYGNHELKIQDIAGEVHFSAAYVSYLFKRETDKNIWDFVSEVRIEEAKRLLGATDLKRYEISYQVGYQSPEHFSRMFKRFTGISPADYRKEVRGN
ncbi:response regulator transcription factor [Paenibacillus ferrarius]|uniref:response regulator transcription factor n=1 Tax=Paenibacillus ferrarius TaxID=1469647 RepID=UPI003D276C8E